MPLKGSIFFDHHFGRKGSVRLRYTASHVLAAVAAQLLLFSLSSSLPLLLQLKLSTALWLLLLPSFLLPLSLAPAAMPFIG